MHSIEITAIAGIECLAQLLLNKVNGHQRGRLTKCFLQYTWKTELQIVSSLVTITVSKCHAAFLDNKEEIHVFMVKSQYRLSLYRNPCIIQDVILLSSSFDFLLVMHLWFFFSIIIPVGFNYLHYLSQMPFFLRVLNIFWMTTPMFFCFDCIYVVQCLRVRQMMMMTVTVMIFYAL